VSDKDVLGKADALLRRHAIPLPGASADSDVPVLTELVDPTPPPAEPMSDLVRTVSEQVAIEVEARLTVNLERRVADELAAPLRAAVAEAMGGLREQIASAVTEAVKQELERRQLK